MTSPPCPAEFYARLMRKLYEDLLEAYMRTPVAISSRPYIERALRLAQAGLEAAVEELRSCQQAPKGLYPQASTGG